MPDIELQYLYRNNLLGITFNMMPLSSYSLPCHSPLKIIGLPSFQSEIAFVPKKYFFISDGVVNASHTFEGGASISILAFPVILFFIFVFFILLTRQKIMPRFIILLYSIKNSLWGKNTRHL